MLAGADAPSLVRPALPEAGAARRVGEALGEAGATLPLVIVAGLDAPVLIEQVLSATRRPAHEAQTGVVLIDSSPERSGADADPQIDVLDAPRVNRFTGAGAIGAFQSWLGARRRLVNRGAIIGADARLRALVSEAMTSAALEQNTLAARLRARANALYERRDVRWWAQRHGVPGIADALEIPGALSIPDAQPLRALVLSSRRTTFVRHSSVDIARALQRRSCEARVLEEPDAWSRLGPVALLEELTAFEPDLILAINTTRASLGRDLPPNIPFLCWVQDDLERIRSRKAGDALGPLDFVFGLLRDELFEEFGYPRSRARRAPAPVAPEKFHPGMADAALAREHECEVAYVGHQSAGPEEFHRAFLRRIPDHSAIARALDALRPAVLASARDARTRRALPAIEAATHEALRAALGAEPRPSLSRTIVSDYAMPLADRALRHETLEWGAELCASRGWRLRIYGNGWGTHPTLAPFWRGPLEHGEALRASYQGARAHLHISIHTLMHQRVFECALSGGLPCCRLTADEVFRLELAVVAETLRREGIAPERAPASLAVIDHPLLAAYAALRQRIDSPLTLSNSGAFRPTDDVLARIRRGDAPPLAHVSGSLLGDFARTTFGTREGLASLLTRAIEDDAWRGSTSVMIAARVRASVTTDAAVRDALSLVRESLVRETGAPGSKAPS